MVSTPVKATLGIRYARTIDNRRFAPAEPADEYLDVATLREVPIFPQLPGRMGIAMGYAPELNPQDEQAFFLNVWAPENAEGLPVLVFLHGGAWSTGGGAVEWYDGSALAAKGIVVVSVNYRLGPVAHIAPVDADPICWTIDDLFIALRWVQDKISDFGGDPDQVTLGGQSAGAWYVHLLSVMPESIGLFSRIAILSSAWSSEFQPWSVDKWRQINTEIAKRLGSESIESVSIERLQAVGQAAVSIAPAFGTVPSGYLPVHDHRVPKDHLNLNAVQAGRPIEAAYFRHTADESSLFMAVRDQERHATRADVEAWLLSLPQDEVPPAPIDLSDPLGAIVQIASWRVHGRAQTRLADAYATAGVPVAFRLFETRSPQRSFGSLHCFDLPFQFGNRHQWPDAPMLDGFPDSDFELISRELIDDLSGFVKAPLNQIPKGHAPGNAPVVLGKIMTTNSR